MANPFSGLITTEFKTLFTDAIDALLENNACTVPCRLIFQGTKVEDCVNCIRPVGGGTSNIYHDGGPVHFRSGQPCPLCGGASKIISDSTETIFLLVLWNYKDWIGVLNAISRPEGSVQTISKMSTIGQLKGANEIIIDTDIEPRVKHRFIRDGEPNICGLGASSYITTLWKKVG